MRIDFIGDQVDTTAPVVEPAVDRQPERRGRVPRPRDAHAQRHRQLRRLARRVLARRHANGPATRRRSASRRAGPTPCATAPRTGRTTRPRSSRSTFTRRRGRGLPAGAARTSSTARSTRALELPPPDDAGDGRAGPERRRRQPRAAARRVLARPRAHRARSAILGQPLPDRRLHAGGQGLRARASTPTSAAQGSTYAQAGLKLFQTNNNWIKVAHTRNADGNPTGRGAARTSSSTLREPTARARSAPAPACGTGNLPTWWMRVVRAGATITASYSLSDPDGRAPNWVALGTANIDTVDAARPPARATSASTAATARSRPATTTSASRRTRRRHRGAGELAHASRRAGRRAAAGTARRSTSTLSAGRRRRVRLGRRTHRVPRRRRRVRGLHGARSRSRPTARTRSSTARPTRRATPRRRSRSTVKLDATAPATTARDRRRAPGPVDADADRGRRDVRRGADRVPRQRRERVRRRRRAALRRRPSGCTYNAASKPAFTADGAYAIEYRSTDAAGNVEAIEDGRRSRSARRRATRTRRSRPATLDPAQPGPGRTYPGPVDRAACRRSTCRGRRRTSTSTPTARCGPRRR